MKSADLAKLYAARWLEVTLRTLVEPLCFRRCVTHPSDKVLPTTWWGLKVDSAAECGTSNINLQQDGQTY